MTFAARVARMVEQRHRDVGGAARVQLRDDLAEKDRVPAVIAAQSDGLRVFLTVHPSYLLRIPDAADKAAERQRFLKDMQAVKGLMA